MGHNREHVKTLPELKAQSRVMLLPFDDGYDVVFRFLLSSDGGVAAQA